MGGAAAFTGVGLPSWTPNSITSIGAMFANAGNFDQPGISSWNVCGVNFLTGSSNQVFLFAGMSQPQHDGNCWTNNGFATPSPAPTTPAPTAEPPCPGATTIETVAALVAAIWALESGEEGCYDIASNMITLIGSGDMISPQS